MKESSFCSPHHHVAFLKTHKCASTAVQNILFRYGEKYNLLFALPTHNYFGGGTRYVNKAMIDSEFVNKLGFDISAVHSKWNMTEMKKIMPEETKFVTIVREPTELFLSLFDYTGMQDTTGMNLETFIRRVGPNGYRKFGYVGYNQMAWDLGLPSGCFKDMEAVDQLDTPLSIPAARDDTSMLTTYTLESDRVTRLFSTCNAMANTVEGSLNGIEVGENEWYLRYLIDSDVEVTWEDIAEPLTIIDCAMKANESESLMFKYTNNVCSIATEGVYNPKQTSCEGEEVFIRDPHGEEVDASSLPDEVLTCCPTETSPCLYYDGFKSTPCNGVRYCHFLGMTLPEPVTDEAKTALNALRPENEMKVTLVNVVYEDEKWVYLPSNTDVEESDWEKPSAIPTTASAVGLSREGKLERYLIVRSHL
ncbi:Galactose-3-O-sulfotransferase [Trinorchestia longiramus]|nr:Galactose-3-O-sulfotransferase [Trinorchestia longiramus]